MLHWDQWWKVPRVGLITASDPDGYKAQFANRNNGGWSVTPKLYQLQTLTRVPVDNTFNVTARSCAGRYNLGVTDQQGYFQVNTALPMAFVYFKSKGPYGPAFSIHYSCAPSKL